MKKNFILIIILSGIIISGCNFLKKEKKYVYYSGTIKNLIIKAAAGDKESNRALSDLIDLRFPLATDYNTLKVDSIRTGTGKLIYLALLTFPNPLYNRFAVYDSTLRAYLIDKSLNGYVDYKTDSAAGKVYIELDESFVSKDSLRLQRTSLYRVFDTTANLVFRNFTGLKTPDNDFFQNISTISEYKITTSIGSYSSSAIFNKSDSFNWDTNKDKYVSLDSLFDKFVINYIDNYNISPAKPEITDYKSAMQSVGIDSAGIQSKNGKKNKEI